MEDHACRYLEQTGYCVICRNFRSRYGEIDIVALEGSTLVFVEVRYRKSGSLVTPEESIDARKICRIRLAVRDYLFRQQNAAPKYESIRVDLCAISGIQPDLEFEILKGVMEF